MLIAMKHELSFDAEVGRSKSNSPAMRKFRERIARLEVRAQGIAMERAKNLAKITDVKMRASVARNS
jgi:hypothetical protein